LKRKDEYRQKNVEKLKISKRYYFDLNLKF